MKSAKIFLGEFEFGTHLITNDLWNGFVHPMIKEEDMESFSKKVRDSFEDNSESYDLLEFGEGEWVWNLYVYNTLVGCATYDETIRIPTTIIDGVTYYDVQIGHCWEHEEVA